MTIENKSKVFEMEMSWIKNETIAEFTKNVVEQLPDYFFSVAASSTGKYHPRYALGNGGLIRHTKAAVGIAHDLLRLEMYNGFTDDEKDLIITALILHDGLKHGEKGSKFTVVDHPVIMSNWIKDNETINNILPKEQIILLCGAIISHMGEWNKNKSGKEIMPKPQTKMEKFVHLCDYLASRKYLEYDFGDNYYYPRITVKNALQTYIERIINICKRKIDSGQDRETLYLLISKHNNGKKNPNSINDLSVAKTIYEELTKEN